MSVVVAMTNAAVWAVAPTITVDGENEQELAGGTPVEHESETKPLNVSSVLAKVTANVAPCPAFIVSLLGESNSLTGGPCLTVVVSLAELLAGLGSV
jgi:hypothetical protein